MQINSNKDIKITERILQILEFKKISEYKFNKDLGFSNGFLNKSREISTDKYANILVYFPDINPEWLLTGKGEMLRGVEPAARQLASGKEPAAPPPVSDSVIAVYKELLREKDATIAHQAEQIGALKKENEQVKYENKRLKNENGELRNIIYSHDIATDKVQELPIPPILLAEEMKNKINNYGIK